MDISPIMSSLGAGNYSESLKRVKRLFGDVSGATTSYPVAAGAVNVVQRRNVKQRTGKRVNPKSVEYLYRLQKAVTSTAIQRWAAMTEYDQNGALPIGYNRVTAGSGNGEYKYPVYIFDATSCVMNVASVRLGATPMYRLKSEAATGNFVWEAVSGNNGFSWTMEAGRGPDSNIQAPTLGPTSMLAWSDIRLAMYGATSQTTRFTVQFIQFVDEVYHPRSTRDDPAVPVTVNANTDDQQGRFDAAMQELVKPLVFHPLFPAGNATNVYRVLKSQSFSVSPDSTTNEAVASPNVCLKLFKRMNRICKWNWQTSDKKATTTSTETKLVVNDIAGLDSNADFNQFFGGTKKPYVHPNARVYMLIYAQAYSRTGVPASGETAIPISSGNTPTFDILVRNKWLYDST